jgi:hypothetical protein
MIQSLYRRYKRRKQIRLLEIERQRVHNEKCKHIVYKFVHTVVAKHKVAKLRILKRQKIEKLAAIKVQVCINCFVCICSDLLLYIYIYIYIFIFIYIYIYTIVCMAHSTSTSLLFSKERS